jgi:methionyl-tRNA formyltransferase
VRIHAACALDEAHNTAPGRVLGAGREGIDVACGQGVLRLLSLQRDGGKPISAQDYRNARRDVLP